jgi:hypothetical protein
MSDLGEEYIGSMEGSRSFPSQSDSHFFALSQRLARLYEDL